MGYSIPFSDFLLWVNLVFPEMIWVCLWDFTQTLTEFSSHHLNVNLLSPITHQWQSKTYQRLS